MLDVLGGSGRNCWLRAYHTSAHQVSQVYSRHGRLGWRICTWANTLTTLARTRLQEVAWGSPGLADRDCKDNSVFDTVNHM